MPTWSGKALGRRTIIQNETTNTKPFFRQEVKALAAEKRKPYIHYIPSRETFDEYKIVRNRANR